MVTKYADWYKVSREQVIRKGGRALFKRHASLESALKAAYGEHEWVSSRFVQAGRVPRGHWDSPTKVREYLDLMKSDLGVEQVLYLSLPRTQWMTYIYRLSRIRTGTESPEETLRSEEGCDYLTDTIQLRKFYAQLTQSSAGNPSNSSKEITLYAGIGVR